MSEQVRDGFKEYVVELERKIATLQAELAVQAEMLSEHGALIRCSTKRHKLDQIQLGESNKLNNNLTRQVVGLQAELAGWEGGVLEPLQEKYSAVCEENVDLQAELEQYRWVPVGERLPEEKHEVLIYYTYKTNQNSYEGIAFLHKKLWYSDDGKTTFTHEEVTHWMPIPPLPSEIVDPSYVDSDSAPT